MQGRPKSAHATTSATAFMDCRPVQLIEFGVKSIVDDARCYLRGKHGGATQTVLEPPSAGWRAERKAAKQPEHQEAGRREVPMDSSPGPDGGRQGRVKTRGKCSAGEKGNGPLIDCFLKDWFLRWRHLDAAGDSRWAGERHEIVTRAIMDPLWTPEAALTEFQQALSSHLARRERGVDESLQDVYTDLEEETDELHDEIERLRRHLGDGKVILRNSLMLFTECLTALGERPREKAQATRLFGQ